jgi:hypothetical protein
MSLSVELRTGSILQEALTRYNLNTVPFWSCLYGTHLMPGPGSESPEEVLRNIEWASIIGDFCKIPHDNRLNLCFRAPMDDIAVMVRVRNFMSHFHKPEHHGSPKGEYFNIWDWFDTGLSAYWYPGRKEPVVQLGSFGSALGSNSCNTNLYRLSSMIAPWRRMVYVRSQYVDDLA